MVVIDKPSTPVEVAVEDAARESVRVAVPDAFDGGTNPRRSFGTLMCANEIVASAGPPPTEVTECDEPCCAGLTTKIEICKGTTAKNAMWAGKFVRVVSADSQIHDDELTGPYSVKGT